MTILFATLTEMRVKCASLDICCDSNCSSNPSGSSKPILRAIRTIRAVFMAYSTKVLIAAWQMSFECSQPKWSGHSQKKRLQTPVDWHTLMLTQQHTRWWGMLMPASLQLVLCSGAAAARRRRPRAWHARNFQSILIGTPSISSKNG